MADARADDDEAAALRRLVETIDRAEGSFLAASLRFPHSEPINRGLAALATVRRRLVKDLRALPQDERTKKFLDEQIRPGIASGCDLLRALHQEAKLPPAPNVQMSAEHAAFLDLAKTGDQKAIAEFMEAAMREEAADADAASPAAPSKPATGKAPRGRRRRLPGSDHGAKVDRGVKHPKRWINDRN